MGVRRGERERRGKKVQRMVGENFPNILKKANLYTSGNLLNSELDKLKDIHKGCIIIKMLKVKNKEKTLKAAREK